MKKYLKNPLQLFLDSPVKPGNDINKPGNDKTKYRTLKQAGFSLLEIIIVIALIGTLVGFIVSRLAGGTDNAKVGITDTKAFTLQSKMIQYQLSNDNQFPTTAQGLQVLTSGSGGVPIATDDDIKDGWGNPFDYKLTAKGPLIISMGKDGQPGTNASICYLGGKKLNICSTEDTGAGN